MHADALAEQQYLSLLQLLSPHSSGLSFETDSSDRYKPLLISVTKKKGPNGATNLAYSRLNFQHPFYTWLKSRYPTIPPMRFSRNIITFYRNDLLLASPAKDVPKLLADAGIDDIRPSVDEEIVGHEVFFDRWRSVLF